MIIPSSIRQKFDFSEPYIVRAGRSVRDVIFAFCEDQGFAFVGRRKTVRAITEKIETGRYGAWPELDDNYACTIIVPTLSQEKEVLEFLGNTFVTVVLRRRGGTLKDPAVFRFDATRFIGKLKIEDAARGESELEHVLFEVQVRTAFEHAWSVATRAFAYKADSVDWRRFRLAAQLKASVEQLDALAAGFESFTENIFEYEWPELAAKRHLEEMAKRLVDEGVIPCELAPESWTRFCENLWALIDASAKVSIKKKLKSAQCAAEKIERRARTQGGAAFPRSIALLQFCMGSLTEEGVIRAPIDGYTPLITQELLDLYPSVRVLGTGFTFETLE